MEQVFYRIHNRLVTTTCQCLSPTMRKLFEFGSFAIAILSLFSLIILHNRHITSVSNGNCLQNSLFLNSNISAIDFSSSVKKGPVIVKIDILPYSQTVLRKFNIAYTTNEYSEKPYFNIYHGTLENITSRIYETSQIKVSSAQNGKRLFFSYGNDAVNIFHYYLDFIIRILERLTGNFFTIYWHQNIEYAKINQSCNNTRNEYQITSMSAHYYKLLHGVSKIFNLHRSYLFSLEKQSLYPITKSAALSSDKFHDESKIGILYEITIFRDSMNCQKLDSFYSLLLDFLIGYDTVVMNWAISIFNGNGVLFNLQSHQTYDLNIALDSIKRSSEQIKVNTVHKKIPFDWHAANSNKFYKFYDIAYFKIGVIFTTIFLFFTTSTVVSFTLKETQEKMLKFTYLLHHHVSRGLPFAALIFTHCVETLVFVPIMVGIMFFLFEFFHDQLLTFMVLSLVWACEIFSVLSLRTKTSIRYFPRIFFFYFCAFHIYFFSFPFGFYNLALFTTVLFLLHAMVHFYNNYEIPALATGQVSSFNLRLGLQNLLVNGIILPTTPTSNESVFSEPPVLLTPNTRNRHENQRRSSSVAPTHFLSPSRVSSPLRPGHDQATLSRLGPFPSTGDQINEIGNLHSNSIASESDGAFASSISNSSSCSVPSEVLGTDHSRFVDSLHLKQPSNRIRSQSSSEMPESSGTANKHQRTGVTTPERIRRMNVHKFLSNSNSPLAGNSKSIGFVPYDLSLSRIKNPKNFPNKQSSYLTNSNCNTQVGLPVSPSRQTTVSISTVSLVSPISLTDSQGLHRSSLQEVLSVGTEYMNASPNASPQILHRKTRSKSFDIK